MKLTKDYAERVYAGVLGKIIGVYLGRPFEGWSYERFVEKLGMINYYVNDALKAPLIVTDDGISGTFTFLRSLPDHGNRAETSSAEIGATWLNYIIEQRTILWWGGMGNSTEHTAYLRLKSGIPAPKSGSIELNGKVVAEQIGAEIFIDGWAMVAPGDPEPAADLARRAASASHEGEAVCAAQLLAAMESMVPNHALIILALLYGNDELQRSLMIVNTSGWDTDCNSGNLGCLRGIVDREHHVAQGLGRRDGPLRCAMGRIVLGSPGPRRGTSVRRHGRMAGPPGNGHLGRRSGEGVRYRRAGWGAPSPLRATSDRGGQCATCKKARPSLHPRKRAVPGGAWAEVSLHFAGKGKSDRSLDR